MFTFNDGRFNIGSRIDVETLLEPILKPFCVVVVIGTYS